MWTTDVSNTVPLKGVQTRFKNTSATQPAIDYNLFSHIVNNQTRSRRANKFLEGFSVDVPSSSGHPAEAKQA
jgi:hypothetical protein